MGFRYMRKNCELIGRLKRHQEKTQGNRKKININ